MMGKKDDQMEDSDMARAESEGMEASAELSELQPASEEMLNMPEFLDQVVKAFFEEEAGLTTVEEAAEDLVERLKMSEFDEALEKDSQNKLREYIQQHVDEETWKKIEEEELARQLRADQTIDGATPG